MGLISMLRIDIDAGVEVYKMTKNGVLIDVRTKEEYAEGHIPDSINLPLSHLDQILYTSFCILSEWFKKRKSCQID